MTRILSQTDNVIAADFRTPAENGIEAKQQILYHDEAVCLVRITYYISGIHVGTQHITVDLTAIS